MKDILGKAVEEWGVNVNLWVFVEEVGELVKEIAKAVRYEPNYNKIIEEVADVEIALELLKIIFKLDQEHIERIKKDKIERLKERLEAVES
ncbi:hypothetical protein DRO97_02820 [Archaeoglobales archaeon]|nr:MAG: hypothetical protein DRO97_02820 [Archaeoglobales archaeon]